MPKASVNNISLYYEIYGQGEPIIFIGGFSADHSVWQEIVSEFSGDYQVILFDNRGAGQTDAPTSPYSIDEMAEDVVALCKSLNIQSVHMVGNSMGGFIVQMLALKHPELIKTATISHSAMTLDTPFHIYVSAQLDLLKANAPLETIFKASCCWAFSYRFLAQPEVLKNLIQWGLDNPYPFTIQGYEGQYAAIDRFNSTQWVSRITIPTLVLGSDQDLIFNETMVKALADKIPQAQYFRFKDCGHLPQIECPQRFAEVIKNFIAKHN